MSQHSILVVEDEAVIAADIAFTLKTQGYNVIGPVSDGESALQAAEHFSPHVILMDIELAGDMNGISAAEKIRSIAPIPVIYLTGYTDEDRLRRALKTNPYGYLLKPVRSRELYSMIEMTLSKSPVDRSIQEKQERFHAVVNRVMEGIIVFDANTKKILDANLAFLDLLGYTVFDLSSLTLYDIITTDLGDIDRDIHNILEEKNITKKMGFRCKDSSEIQKIVRAEVIESSNFSVIIFIIPLLFSKDKNFEGIPEEINQKLRLLISLTRHDILNHLSAIIGAHSLICNESDPHYIQKYVSLASKVCNSLETTIGFTREYENLGSEHPRWMQIPLLLRLAMDEVSLGRVIMDVQVPEDVEIYSDPLIRKVFSTLLENAIRHGGNISMIQISCLVQDNSMILIFENDGSGIPNDEKELIFEHGYGNHTGVGLYLAREILSITGLSIHETGDPERGARFEITIPAKNYRRAIKTDLNHENQ